MFERNKVDNSLQQSTVPAQITLVSGEVLKGRFLINASRSIYDVLNGETQFLEFETYDGGRSLISKATLAAIEIVSLPSSSGLKSRIRDADTFDPHAVLGVQPSASWEQVRHAYIKLSKVYHPDLFTGVTLPGEVREYLAAMARRINDAYHALEVPQQAMKRAVVEKAKPVFTSPQRV